MRISLLLLIFFAIILKDLHAQCGDSYPITTSDLCDDVLELDIDNELYKVRYCSNHLLGSTNNDIKRVIIWLHGSCRNPQDKYNDLIASANSHGVMLDTV